MFVKIAFFLRFAVKFQLLNNLLKLFSDKISELIFIICLYLRIKQRINFYLQRLNDR